MHGTDPRLDDPPGFVGGTLDRVDHIRSNPALLAETFADPAARVLVLRAHRLGVCADPHPPPDAP